MPELPEIESLRRSLTGALVGQRLGSLAVYRTDLREPLDVPALEVLVHQRITDLRRRAKYLLIDLESGTTLVVHLGMSGQLTLVSAGEERARHEHLAFRLAEGRLRYVDARRFGLLFPVATQALDRDRHFVHLGPEPLDPSFDGESLRSRARSRRGPIKTYLMDSKVVVGVGNIYASEALHAARIHPARGVHRIAALRWQRLAHAVRETLAGAISRGGTTLSDYTDGYGNLGRNQTVLAVYGREGEPCPRCAAAIRRSVQSGRSTYYCPGCQH